MMGTDRQTVADVALSGTGVSERMFSIAQECDVGLSDSMSGVTARTEVADKKTTDYYARQGVLPATEYDYEPDYLCDNNNETITGSNNENIEV